MLDALNSVVNWARNRPVKGSKDAAKGYPARDRARTDRVIPRGQWCPTDDPVRPPNTIINALNSPLYKIIFKSWRYLNRPGECDSTLVLEKRRLASVQRLRYEYTYKYTSMCVYMQGRQLYCSPDHAWIFKGATIRSHR